MWTAPPPAWNQTVSGFDEAKTETVVIQVLNGSTNVLIKWNYNLLGNQSIKYAFFAIDMTNFGVVEDDWKSDIVVDFRNRFSIETTSEYSSLTINTVTERENATFQCRLWLTDGSNWGYNIRIEVTGMKSIIFDSNCYLTAHNVTYMCLLITLLRVIYWFT